MTPTNYHIPWFWNLISGLMWLMVSTPWTILHQLESASLEKTHTHTYENKLKQPTTIYSGLDVDKLTADQLKWNLIERCSTCVYIYIILYIHTRIHIGFYYNHHMLVISSTKQWDPPGSRQGWDLIAWTPRFRRRCSGIPRTEFMKNPGKHTNKTIENGHL